LEGKKFALCLDLISFKQQEIFYIDGGLNKENIIKKTEKVFFYFRNIFNQNSVVQKA
jgi:hypothetical protein